MHCQPALIDNQQILLFLNLCQMQYNNQIQHLFKLFNQRMSAFKKKNSVSQPVPTIQQMNNKLNLLLGLGSSQAPPQRKSNLLNKQLILACAMFWDSKKRIDKIKSLVLKQQNLQQFNNTQDFQVSELMSIQLLSLSKNNIMHLQPLSVLDTLVCLNINNNRVYDLSPISQLAKLEELYASNNQINHIDPLKNVAKLRILNLYRNKINRLDETVAILQCLKSIEQLDIQQNPIYSESVRSRFLSLQKLARFNGQLILEQERQNLGIMISSVVMLPSAKFRDTHTSFWGSNKSQVKTWITGSSEKQSNSKTKTKSQLIKIVEELEKKYLQIDDKFQQQIVKNVQLKSRFQRKSEQKKQLQRKNEDMKQKQQQTTQLKRKVKMLKQNLFNNSGSQRKGQLLRQLFELEMMSQSNKNKAKNQQKIKNQSRDPLWMRKFDYDQQIFIDSKVDDQYLFDEDEQLAMLLTQNTSTLQQLKRELREMNH